MTAFEILDEIAASGASVSVSAGRLLVVGRLGPALLTALSEHRLAVAAIIREHEDAPSASDAVRAAEELVNRGNFPGHGHRSARGRRSAPAPQKSPKSSDARSTR